MIWSQLYKQGEQFIAPFDVPGTLHARLNYQNLRLADYLVDGEKLYGLAEAYRQMMGLQVVHLPLDHNLEYRCLGAVVADDFDKGSRLVTGVQQLAPLEEALQHPTFLALIKAIQLAKENQQFVVTNVTGIYTLLEGLIGTGGLAKFRRVEFIEKRQQIVALLIAFLLRLLRERVDLIHLGDPLVFPHITGLPFIRQESQPVYTQVLNTILPQVETSQSILCLHPGLGYLISQTELFKVDKVKGLGTCWWTEVKQYRSSIITINLDNQLLVVRREEKYSESKG